MDGRFASRQEGWEGEVDVDVEERGKERIWKAFDKILYILSNSYKTELHFQNSAVDHHKKQSRKIFLQNVTERKLLKLPYLVFTSSIQTCIIIAIIIIRPVTIINKSINHMVNKNELNNFAGLDNYHFHACLFHWCLSCESSCQLNVTTAVLEHFGLKPYDSGEPLSFVFFLFYLQMTTGHKPVGFVLLSTA